MVKIKECVGILIGGFKNIALIINTLQINRRKTVCTKKGLGVRDLAIRLLIEEVLFSHLFKLLETWLPAGADILDLHAGHNLNA